MQQKCRKIINSNIKFDHTVICTLEEKKNDKQKQTVSKKLNIIPVSQSLKVTRSFKKHKKQLICTTYQSLPQLIELLESKFGSIHPLFDFVSFDEAHHTCEAKGIPKSFYYQDGVPFYRMCVFYTATPYEFMIDNCTERITHLPYMKGVENKIVQPFDLIINFGIEDKSTKKNIESVFEAILRMVF